MNGELSPGVSTRMLSPFSMKWTLIPSTVAFVASTLIAAIDDEPSSPCRLGRWRAVRGHRSRGGHSRVAATTRA